MYIVFEGIVGTGKTTQSKRLVKYLKEQHKKKVIWTREPGGTEIAEAIRKLVQGTKFKEKMDPICDHYLYAAARAQSLSKIVKPSLKSKKFVVSDRSFISALVRDIETKKALKINAAAIENLLPDLIFYIKLDPETGLSRIKDGDNDKFERKGIAFYKKINKGYELVSRMRMFKGKWINIDGRGSEDEVFKK